uniref:Uncharacterized protein n=1 Tax=Tetraselmis sp. GSL018 TaxID=582737 RepID=A0A061R710_9CHLO
MSSGDKEKHFDRQYSEHKLIQDCTHRLKQLGDDVFNAADYSESQLVRHADKAGVSENAKLYTRQCLTNITQELVTLARSLESQLETHALTVDKMERQADLLVKHVSAQDISTASERVRSLATRRPYSRSQKTFRLE